MNKPTLLLHIGLTKTGTTTLQLSLFDKHPQVYYLGKSSGGPMDIKLCSSDLSYSILNPILWKLKKPLDTKAVLSLYQEKLLPMVSEEQILVASFEGLGNRTNDVHKEMLSRIKTIFGQCRLMITLRNPITRLPSQYLQNLRENFISQNHHWMGSKSYADIETWYRGRMRRRRDPLMDYSACIQSSVEQLGRENVGVFLFEELHQDSNAYYQSICEFVGIDSEIGVSLAKNEHFHSRLTEAQVAHMREINSSFLKRTHNSFSDNRSRIKALKENANSPPAKAVLPEELKKKVSDATRVGHRWLVDNLDLPLEKYGYPL